MIAIRHILVPSVRVMPFMTAAPCLISEDIDSKQRLRESEVDFKRVLVGSNRMRMAITSFSALLIGLSLLAMIPALDSPDSETLVDRSREASVVLEPPVLKGIELVDDDLIL